MDHSSKWAAMSYFETDPRRIKHHIEILEEIERLEHLDAIAAKDVASGNRTLVCGDSQLRITGTVYKDRSVTASRKE